MSRVVDVLNVSKFQQNGIPPHPHCLVAVRSYLETILLGCWMGRGGLVASFPGSPDFTSLDLFLWGRVNHYVFLEDIQFFVIKRKFSIKG